MGLGRGADIESVQVTLMDRGGLLMGAFRLAILLCRGSWLKARSACPSSGIWGYGHWVSVFPNHLSRSLRKGNRGQRNATSLRGRYS